MKSDNKMIFRTVIRKNKTVNNRPFTICDAVIFRPPPQVVLIAKVRGIYINKQISVFVISPLFFLPYQQKAAYIYCTNFRNPCHPEYRRKGTRRYPRQLPFH